MALIAPKVCLVGHSFSDSDTRKIRYAEALVENGASVDVVGLGRRGQPCAETINGVRYHRIQERRRDETTKAAFVRKLCTFFFRSAAFVSIRHVRYGYDVIHVNSVPDFEVFAAWLPKLCGAKVILDIYDVSPEFYLSKFGQKPGCLGHRILLAVERLATRFADHVIIANHLWYDLLVSRGVPAEKCSVYVNYLDPEIFRPLPRTRNEDKIIVVYPGNLNRHQGVDIAIEAFAEFAERVPQAQFHIYGDGPEKGKLLEMVRAMGLGRQIFLKPSVPHRVVPRILANADIGVVGKRADVFGNEAFSTKIIEYMSQGLPVIAPRTKIDAYYFDDTCVRFYEPGDSTSMAKAMLDIHTNPPLRRALIDAGRRCAAKFSWETKKPDYLALVESLLSHDKLKT